MKTRIVTTGGRLKELQNKRRLLAIELESYTNERLARPLRTELRRLDNTIRRLQSQPVITEHAILRYIERVMGIDVAAIEREMLDSMTEQRIDQFGFGTAKIPIATHRGVRLVVQDKTVVTVECFN